MPPKFLSTTRGCGTSPFHVSTPPTSLDGCGFFNSIVVGLPFNSISDNSKRWLFYILVVILMWLCVEASRVYPCCYLDWKSNVFLFQDCLAILGNPLPLSMISLCVFVKCFSCIYSDDYVVLVLYSIDRYIALIYFHMLDQTCIPGINPTWP